VIAFLPGWIVLAFKILGGIAVIIALLCFAAVAALIVQINRNPPEEWNGRDEGGGMRDE
jgi:hypothetical protein